MPYGKYETDTDGVWSMREFKQEDSQVNVVWEKWRQAQCCVLNAISGANKDVLAGCENFVCAKCAVRVVDEIKNNDNYLLGNGNVLSKIEQL